MTAQEKEKEGTKVEEVVHQTNNQKKDKVAEDKKEGVILMTTWQPNIFDTDDVENNSEELITQAISQGINRLGIKSYKRVKDTHGTFAIMTDKCILCAKSYIYGFMVSCHKQLLEIAEENKLELVMYIQKADKFYKFNPADCLKEGTGNRRGESEMWNFKVGFGEDVENPQGRVLIQGKKGQVRLESWFQ